MTSCHKGDGAPAQPMVAGPCWGEESLRRYAQAFPKTHVRKEFSTDQLLGQAGRAGAPGGQVTSSTITPPSPPEGRAGALCGERLAAGPAGTRPGTARTGPTCAEERKRRRPGADNKGERREEEAGKEEEAAEKPAGPDRGWGRGAADQATQLAWPRGQARRPGRATEAGADRHSWPEPNQKAARPRRPLTHCANAGRR